MVSLKYITNFRRKIEMTLINCQINVILTFSANCVIIIKRLKSSYNITDDS